MILYLGVVLLYEGKIHDNLFSCASTIPMGKGNRLQHKRAQRGKPVVRLWHSLPQDTDEAKNLVKFKEEFGIYLDNEYSEIQQSMQTEF